MNKVMVVLGTRPELLRLSLIINKLRAYMPTVLVHTGQNYDERLNDIFFKELNIAPADYVLNTRDCSFGQQVGIILTEVDKIIKKEKPTKVLILGDTTSALSAIIAEKNQIPVWHVEAGNRCYDKSVPEEINRKIVDSISSYNLPYTQNSKQALLHDGIPENKIFVTGNPIFEVIQAHKSKINQSKILKILKLKPKHYFLATFHRSENVDNPNRLQYIIEQLECIADYHKIPMICSIHPRTADKIKEFKITYDSTKLKFNIPFGFFDFLCLESNATAILSDSGTVGEEACILQVPHIILRSSTERTELLECGASILAGFAYNSVFLALQKILTTNTWAIPPEYTNNKVSEIVVNLLHGDYK